MLAIAVGLGSQGAAQSPSIASTDEPPQRPTYQPYRYDEDWSVLRDARLRNDRWDPLKRVPLDHERDWYLSVGGESRWRYEQVENPGFGPQPSDGSGYMLQRYLVHTDWHLGRRARVFAELQSGLETGRDGGPRPTDENRLDLHQAFIDLTWGDRTRRAVTVRAGRHEVAFGAGRLISAAEGLNVRRAFDGIRMIAKHHRWTANATLMRLVETNDGIFDDHADRGHLSWGFGGFGPLPGGRGDNLAVYYIGLQRDAVRFDQGTANTTRHVVGARTWRVARGFDYDQEAIVQWGRFGVGRIRAWAFASEQGVTPRWLPARSRAGIRIFIASGDQDPADPNLQSFDALFPGIAYSGRAGLVGPTNLMTVDPSFAFSVHPRIRVSVDWAHFWRTSVHDGLYGINGAVLRAARESDRRAVGSQATLEVELKMSTHLTVWASIVGFQTRAFLEQSPPSDNLRYVAAHVAYRF